MVRLEGDSVVIRPLRPDELGRMISGRAALGEKVQPSPGRDPEQLRKRIERSGTLHDGRIDMAIEVGGRLIGDIQTYRPPNRRLPPGVFEIGIALYDPADRGKGFGTEAIRVFVDWLFGQGAESVQGATVETNHPMRQTFDKLGFRVLGTVDVEGVEELLYRVTRSDWES